MSRSIIVTGRVESALNRRPAARWRAWLCQGNRPFIEDKHVPGSDIGHVLIKRRSLSTREIALVDDLVSADEQRLWHCLPKRFRGLQIDHQIEFRRLLDRQIGWAGASEVRAGGEAKAVDRAHATGQSSPSGLNAVSEASAMRRVALIVCFFVVAMAGAAYGQQQQPRFTTCSQVAEFSKQQCASTYRPVICQNTVEQNRTSCLASGTWQKSTFSGGAGGQPITNLRRE